MGALDKVDAALGGPVQNVSRQYSENTDASVAPPKAKIPGVEHAQQLAAKSGDTATAASTVGVHVLKQKGEASKMRPQGSDESYQTHGSNPQRAAWEDGHSLNESYKSPSAVIGSHTQNHSYMHPLHNPDAANAPKKAGTDPGHGEKELRTKAPSGMSGKIVFSPQVGKNKS